jgi:hypothetical protein
MRKVSEYERQAAECRKLAAFINESGSQNLAV